ncbi:uncharacterized protein HKW66_Vig0126160 [Vigna angularis]|uniref:Uncharacterized protein n=1 Tax=Phaseolus angularis TaxID=3914 RepID=A0A8T0K6G6_PHAAN|nr:uncharacterized protein HKW66_Vig0126160 [Vigna angularis]
MQASTIMGSLQQFVWTKGMGFPTKGYGNNYGFVFEVKFRNMKPCKASPVEGSLVMGRCHLCLSLFLKLEVMEVASWTMASIKTYAIVFLLRVFPLRCCLHNYAASSFAASNHFRRFCVSAPYAASSLRRCLHIFGALLSTSLSQTMRNSTSKRGISSL